MTDTPLDIAYAALQTGGEAAWLAFYDKLAGSELFLLLAREPEGDQIAPRVFELTDQAYVLAFDREERLAQFTGSVAPYAALSGQMICRMLAPDGLGIGLNLDVAPSSMLMPPDAVNWLAALDMTPQEVETQIAEIRRPGGLPDRLLTALDARLAAAGGLADCAYLAGVSHAGAGTGHMLGFVGARRESQAALAGSVAQALAFSGLEAGVLDVGFFDPEDPMVARLAACGLRFDLPRAPQPLRPSAPGMDPDKPPKLR